MLDKPAVNAFAHVKPGDTPWVGEGLRDFFLYRDLGIMPYDEWEAFHELFPAEPVNRDFGGGSFDPGLAGSPAPATPEVVW